VIAGVMSAWLRTSGRTGLHLIGGGPGERALAARWLGGLVAADSQASEAPGEEAAPASGTQRPEGPRPTAADEETERFRARLAATRTGGEVAHLANRTFLLLTDRPPPERILPLGDLRASDVLALGGTPALPPPFQAVAEDRQALTELDEAVDDWIARSWGSRGSSHPVASARWRPDELEAVLRRGFLARVHDRVVPKLGSSTPWVDLDS
jgi:hypothetical protein